ncbi:(2Fe-2S)-binding protein [Halobacillus andaensis]|uniref:(2Fe-2S)-binding protein n=1 Tax=Halobacillus andaensis TaxID=1176239 RepID=UPI003D760DFE
MEQAKNFTLENTDVAKEFVKGKLESRKMEPENLSPGEGAVVRLNGKRAGACKDETGRVYLVDTTCTHMGCEVNWNNAEQSWDCPCHGSRFTIDGEVIEGPATKPLKELKKGGREVISPELFHLTVVFVR